jgi:hypothetical protein
VLDWSASVPLAKIKNRREFFVTVTAASGTLALQSDERDFHFNCTEGPEKSLASLDRLCRAPYSDQFTYKLINGW